jgi:hypothetical protein
MRESSRFGHTIDANRVCSDPLCESPRADVGGGENVVICERCGAEGCDACITYDDQRQQYTCDHCLHEIATTPRGSMQRAETSSQDESILDD